MNSLEYTTTCGSVVLTHSEVEPKTLLFLSHLIFPICPRLPAVLTQVCADTASHHVLHPGSAPASRHNVPRGQMALRLPRRASSIPSPGICRQPGLTLSKDKDAETALSFMFFVSPLFPGGRDKQLFVGTLAHTPPKCAVRCCSRNRARCAIQEQDVQKPTGDHWWIHVRHIYVLFWS